jgi:hypothetical protein
LRKNRRWGDRRDGRLVRDLDIMHAFSPHLMPNRADCETFIREQIDLTNLLAYLKQKNEGAGEYPYTIFHVICAAVVQTLFLRPRLNRFSAGRRTYQRDTVSLAFVAKRRFADDGAEALLFLDFGEETTVDTVRSRIWEEVSRVRSGGADNSTDAMGLFVRLPRPLLMLAMRMLRILDFFGKVPYSLIREDPNYASVFLSNLGSIGLDSIYHHLNNWGTNSVFVVIGKRHFAPVCTAGGFETREVLNIGITLDERIADGYYFSESVRILKQFLQNPELLESPASAGRLGKREPAAETGAVLPETQPAEAFK